MNAENAATVDVLKQRFESFQCTNKPMRGLEDKQSDIFVNKINIKRTPAFRRDAKVPKHLGENPQSKKVANKQFYYCDNNNSKKTVECGTDVASKSFCFKSYNSNKISDLNHCINNDKLVSSHQVLVECLKKELKKSSYNNNKDITSLKNNIEHISTQTPLPSGPPPKKPPRTFAHDKQTSLELNVKPTMDVHKKPKSDPKIMLQKLEQFVVNNSHTYQKENVVVDEIPDRRCDSKKSQKKSKMFSLAKSLKCIGNSNVYDNTTKIHDTDDQNYLTSKFYYEHDTEHIYDEPVFLNQNSRINTNSVDSRHALDCNELACDSDKSNLHYMSTPIKDYDSKNECLDQCDNFPSIDLDGLDDFDGPSNKDKTVSHEKKIQMLMNEAYGTFIKAQESESDSESVSNNEDSCNSSINYLTDANISEQTLERKGYLRRVAKNVTSAYSTLIHDKKHLFQALLLIGLDLSSTREKLPYVKYKYPEQAEVPKQIESLCFPDSHVWPFTADDCRTYTLTVTDESGRRYYGYCYRIQPEGASYCLPLVYCLYSTIKANSFYFRVLKEIESRHGLSEMKCFIESLHDQPFPELGSAIRIPHDSSIVTMESAPNEEIRRPLDIRQEQDDILRLLQVIKPTTFIQLLATMLLERKLILLSKSISLLSSSIEGLTAALYPFTWQHTLVSVLPSQMVSVADFVQAPTPYIIGLLKSDNQSDIFAQFSENDQVFIFDLDSNKVLRKVKDEYSVIPSRIAKGLKSVISLKVDLPHSTKAILASESLIRLFVELVGHYRMYVVPTSKNKQFQFQKQSFINAGINTAHRNFLEWFTETAMFTTFINNRLNCDVDVKDVFERRCAEFSLELNKIKQKSKTLQTVKAIGDRIKDWAVS
ncbi:DENN domain-containing protein 2B-like [Adelges cooleyi]|uniref:DENN domain-containing protein 2B-like n=1 Tax=Adelges cooleyi TaxID=133065 RepID=UPI0021806327|nr:DENN domain-containing protein 2B-like [Adelges cooleyi]